MITTSTGAGLQPLPRTPIDLVFVAGKVVNS